jgi:hypothetical protein
MPLRTNDAWGRIDQHPARRRIDYDRAAGIGVRTIVSMIPVSIPVIPIPMTVIPIALCVVTVSPPVAAIVDPLAGTSFSCSDKQSCGGQQSCA